MSDQDNFLKICNLHERIACLERCGSADEMYGRRCGD